MFANSLDEKELMEEEGERSRLLVTRKLQLTNSIRLQNT